MRSRLCGMQLSLLILMGCKVIAFGIPGSDEVSTVEKLQNTIRAMETLLEKQQKRLLSGFDGMRKRVHALEKMADRTKKEIEHNTSVVCSSLPSPPDGRVLGARRRSVGDVAYYVCDPDFRLVGNEERVCLENGTWSGYQPRCQSIFPIADNQFVRISDCATSSPGIKTCSCPIGFKISLDQSRCLDIDECQDILDGERIMRIADCQYKCRNQPGSYECLCPSGYVLKTDRRCRDRDECADGSHKCSSRHQCINTFGGHECVTTGCPAHFIRTGERTCQKIPCREHDEECSRLPHSIMYYYMAVTPNLEIPSNIFRLTTDSRVGGTTRFRVLSGEHSFYFTSRRVDRTTGWLVLSGRPSGPKTLRVDFEAREHGRTGQIVATHLAKIVLYVSEHSY